MKPDKDNPVERKPRKLSNAARLRIFLGVSVSLVALVLFISCREKAEKRNFSEMKGFNTPVQTEEISLPSRPAELPPDHPSIDGGPSDEEGSLPEGHPDISGNASGGAPGADGAPVGKLKWTLPKGWTARAGSGMYYAIIKTSGEAEASEIGVLALPGEAGGLAANAVRWSGQLGIQTSEDKIGGFLSKSARIRSKGNLDVTLLDYNPVVKGDDGVSMLVAIAKPAEDSYFIKMTGRKADLLRHKRGFTQLCESLEFQ